MKKLKVILCLIFSINSYSSINTAIKIYSTGEKAKYPQLINELIEDDMYFSATPFVKEYLASSSGRNNSEFDLLLDKVITKVGIKQFETLPVNILEKSNAATIRYILARKAFRNSKLDQSLNYLNKNIEEWNAVKPFSLFLEGSIYALTKKEDQAIRTFKECVDISSNHISKEKDENKIMQLKIAKDYCIVGIARSQFSIKKFEEAYSSYLDLQKSSHIWPEILFEEAWNSFYLKDYDDDQIDFFSFMLLSDKKEPLKVEPALAQMPQKINPDKQKIIIDHYLKTEKPTDIDSWSSLWA